MNLEAQLTALKNQSANLTLAERAELSCRIAKQLEKIGEYEAAREALSEFWPDRDGPPKLDDLNESHQWAKRNTVTLAAKGRHAASSKD